MTGWKQTTLGAIAEADGCRISTGPFGSQLHKHDYEEEGIGVVNPTHIEQWKVSHESVPRISAANAERLSKHRLLPNDLLFARRGEIGRHAVISEDERDWLCGTGCFVVRIAQSQVEPRFVSYFLSTDESIDWLKRHAGGVVMPNLSNTVLQRVPVALPPLPEQKKIAHILSTVQRAIEEQERIIQTTTELKKALMHKLFTEGLRNEPQKQTEIGPVPKSWELEPLGDLAKVGNGSTPKRDNQAFWQGGTIPWLNSARIHDRFITEPDQFVTGLAVKQCHLPRVKANSLLIAITGQGKTLGNSAITRFETCINQHLAYAQFTSEKIVPDFVLWFMQTRYDFLRGMAQAGGSTKGALTCGYLKTHLIPIPSIGEQQEIVNVFNALDQKEKTATRKRGQFQDLFRTLLHELMTSKIRVHRNTAKFTL